MTAQKISLGKLTAQIFFRHFILMTQLTQIPDELVFPHLHLLVSGGNSQLLLLNSFSDWQIIGQTLDDAAGECFDKIGRMIGFQYPAGVSLAKTAKFNDTNYLKLTVGMQGNNQNNKPNNYNYSFSGLKTAVRYLVQKSTINEIEFEKSLQPEEIKQLIKTEQIGDLESEKLKFIYQICCSTQSVVITQLLNKVEKALKNYSIKSIGLSGGVSANLLLRQKLTELTDAYSIQYLFKPHLKLTGDNAIMIGLAGLAGLYEENKTILK